MDNKILQYFLKGLFLIGVIGVLALALAVLGYGIYKSGHLFSAIFSQTFEGKSVVAEAMHDLDLILVGITILVAAIGLFELFIYPIPNLPSWMKIEDLDELKSMLIKVSIVVMAISFMGKVVTWNGETDLLGYGIAMGTVIIALSYFIGMKSKH